MQDKVLKCAEKNELCDSATIICSIKFKNIMQKMLHVSRVRCSATATTNRGLTSSYECSEWIGTVNIK